MVQTTLPQASARYVTGKDIIKAEQINKTFPMPDKGEMTVLRDISITLHEGEVLALLGRSGSGKSTLLRILAGLIPASSGTVLYNGKPIEGPNQNVTMIFQSFALLPWLTVEDNVALGLKAQGIAKDERHIRALKAIDMVGLDGFEGAFPRELSGGMRQRVGFARAFVMQPDALFMDEPMSALDVLTAENLRGELMELWTSKKLPTRAILIVTHNIEEAIQLADRVIILGQNPGVIRAEMPIELPHPRDRKSPSFIHLVDTIYKVMTNPKQSAQEILSNANKGDIELTEDGKRFAAADILTRKHLFRVRLLACAPFARKIHEALVQQPRHVLSEEFFEDILDEHFTQNETEQQMDTVIDWGRYAELFEYDATRGVLMLSQPEINQPEASPTAP